MDIREAVESRFSCRAFRGTPVDDEIVRDILAQAARAPSGGNVQPWRVHVLAGEPLQRLKSMIVPRALETPRGEGAEYEIYPAALKEPYEQRRRTVGEVLYRAIAVPREDRASRYRQYARNFAFFEAPVGMFFSIDRQMGPPQWSDLGMYIQTVMVLARGHGLDTCAQEAWTFWHQTVGEFLQLAPEHILFCGLALGHADRDAPINSWRSERAPLADFASFHGFDESR